MIVKKRKNIFEIFRPVELSLTTLVKTKNIITIKSVIYASLSCHNTGKSCH